MTVTAIIMMARDNFAEIAERPQAKMMNTSFTVISADIAYITYARQERECSLI